ESFTANSNQLYPPPLPFSAGPSKQEKLVSRGRHGGRSDGFQEDSPVLSNPKSVLKRQVSPEELQKPGGKYIKRTFTIVGDAVGWGFVVRGNGPCHIQAVDPSGPAAAVGMKVCQFVVSVNGINVLEMDYRTISHLILTGPRTVVMEVMEPLDC
ncbi:hypothetical protein NFI96_017988, partial [Prochilodus magdalenae]